MRDWIAGAMTVLGTLLVLSGAAIIILRAWGSGLRPQPATPDAPTTTESTSFTADAGFPAPASPPPAGAQQTVPRGSFAERGATSLLRLGGPDRLIAWGILLLLLASIAAGAIGFQLGASATAR